MSTSGLKPGPIEVWLSKKNIEVTCMVVHEDESTISLDVDSLSMRGAQREMTAWLINKGYKPVGRWETEASTKDKYGDDDVAIETVRTFKFLAAETEDAIPVDLSLLGSTSAPLERRG